MFLIFIHNSSCSCFLLAEEFSNAKTSLLIDSPVIDCILTPLLKFLRPFDFS